MSVEWEDAGMRHRVDRAAVESILKRMDAAIAVRNTAVADIATLSGLVAARVPALAVLIVGCDRSSTTRSSVR